MLQDDERRSCGAAMNDVERREGAAVRVAESSLALRAATREDVAQT